MNSSITELKKLIIKILKKMNFETKHIGAHGNKPASILELTVNGCDYKATENILDFKTNKIDENFIMELRQLADELQEHNDLIDSK